MPFPCRFLEQFENDIVRRVGRFADFLNDDFLFFGKLFRIEQRVLQNVRQDIDAKSYIVFQKTNVVPRALMACRSVQVAADGFDLLCDFARRTLFRAFESHMFKKMRNAVFFGALVR